MKALKNSIVGFLVSFVGSIPLGYLNIIGFEVYSKSGINQLIYYLLGVIIIEAIVIYGTLIFANKLADNKKLIKYIEVFSIVFMLLLAASFYFQSNDSQTNGNYLSKYINYAPFFIGVIFSSLNFIQIPFWTAWNLYLVNNNYIAVEKNVRLFYIFGTLVGTFCGMFLLILFLKLVDSKMNGTSSFVVSHLIPLVFLGLAIIQAFKFYKKYFYRK